MEILYEDKDLLVVVKPANIATETSNIRQKDMVTEIRQYLMSTSKAKQEPYVGLIHRLDQPVSGILVFAKNAKSAAKLSAQVQSKTMDKHYIAVVDGIVNPSLNIESDTESNILNCTNQVHTLTNYIYRDSKENKAKISTNPASDAKLKPQRAELTYQVIAQDKDKNCSRLEIHLITGRFHQIRCQLSNIGHPIVNDTKYGYSGSKEEKYKGIALCAYKLSFDHPANSKRMSFEIPF